MTERATAKTFRDLRVWQKAHEFVLAVYKYSEGFPKSELFGLTSQLRRAAVSISANIAEGFGRYHYLDKNKFNYNARGSLNEATHWTKLLAERKLISANQNELFETKFNELGPKLNNYISSTRELKKS